MKSTPRRLLQKRVTLHAGADAAADEKRQIRIPHDEYPQQFRGFDRG